MQCTNRLLKQDVAVWISLLIGISSCLFISATFYVKSCGVEPITCHGRSRLASHESPLEDDVSWSRDILVSVLPSSYDIDTELPCFTRHCKKKNNYWALRSCVNEKLDDFSRATDWNTIGVMTMERYTQMGFQMSEGFPLQLLKQAELHFSNASAAADHQCWSAALNWAIVLMKLEQHSLANEKYEIAEVLSPNAEQKAIVHVFWGLNEELGGGENSTFHYDQVRSLDPGVEMDYWGVATTRDSRKELRTDYGPKDTPPAVMDYLLYKHFARISIAEYALIQPDAQDFFIKNRYVILRDILPPFILNTARTCFQKIIQSGHVQVSDHQSKRFVTYNDRCSRFIQYQLSDLIRVIVVHNVRPSYTYFGGYKSGATLAPHTDRPACEFTVSLNIHQYPHDKPWTLSLSTRPLFNRDPNWNGGPAELPPESEVAHANLFPGDALLFMGRHLVHFRGDPLPEGHSTNQIFLHYVQGNFSGILT